MYTMKEKERINEQLHHAEKQLTLASAPEHQQLRRELDTALAAADTQASDCSADAPGAAHAQTVMRKSQLHPPETHLEEESLSLLEEEEEQQQRRRTAGQNWKSMCSLCDSCSYQRRSRTKQTFLSRRGDSANSRKKGITRWQRLSP